MTTDRIIEVLLAAISVTIGFAAYKLATRASTEQAQAVKTTVDAAAYGRAREIYESALATLREELAATRSELVTARGDIISLREELRSVRTELMRLRSGNGEQGG